MSIENRRWGAIGDLAGQSHMAVTACFFVIAGLVPAMTMGGTQRRNRSYAIALPIGKFAEDRATPGSDDPAGQDVIPHLGEVGQGQSARHENLYHIGACRA